MAKINPINPYKNVVQYTKVSLEPHQMNSDISIHLKANLKKKVEKKCNKNGFVDQVYKILLYGDESEQLKTVATKSDTSIFNDSEHDPDYVEKTFIDYFHDEMSKPIELITETITGKDRKLIKKEANSEYLKSILKDLNLSVPMVIKNMLKYAEIDENYVENNLNYEDLRRELLMILNFDRVVPPNVTKSNILSTIDEKHQGMHR